MLLSVLSLEKDELIFQVFGLSNDDCEREAFEYLDDYRVSYSLRRDADFPIFYAYPDPLLDFCSSSGVELDPSMSPMDAVDFFQSEISTGKLKFSEVKSLMFVIESLQAFYKNEHYFNEILF